VQRRNLKQLASIQKPQYSGGSPDPKYLDTLMQVFIPAGDETLSKFRERVTKVMD
jgi:hypothetical protein